MAKANYPVEAVRKVLDEGIPYGPRIDPCVCGAPRHAHAGKTRGGAHPATHCTRYREDLIYQYAYKALDGKNMELGAALQVADRMIGEQHRKRNPVQKGQWRVSVSDTDTCRKAIWYRNKPPVDLIRAWEDKREAAIGTIIHEGVERRLAMVFPWRMFEHEVIVPGLDRKSRIDWYDPFTCELGDIKTAGDWRWDKLGDDGPDEKTWDKVYIYAYAMEQMGFPVRTVRLDYIKRANGHDETFVLDYDQARAEAALDYLLSIATALDLDLDLPRDGEGPDRDALCRRCPFRLHCWNIPAAEKANRSPYSLTLLGLTPDEAAIADAIEAHVEAAAAQRKAKAAVDQAKDLLDGIDPGRYGGYEGWVQRGNSGPDWKEYAARLQSYWDLPAEQRPPLENIPGPRDRTYASVRWGRVRKATLERAAKAAAAGEIGSPTTTEKEAS